MELNKTIVINRDYENTKQTLGRCSVICNGNNIPIFSSLSLERGWLDNQQNISCVPSGEYTVKLEYSHKFDCLLWEIKGVENRSETKFHSANYWHELRGCVALGVAVRDFDNDGYLDISSSRTAMRQFHKAIGGEDCDTLRLIVINSPQLLENR